jgi:hypothetical protein
MEKLILQLQAALAVLAALLPLAPAKSRATIAHGLEAIAAALRLGELAAGAAQELAERVAALQTEVAANAEIGEADLEAAFERVRAASAAFRAAFAQS